MGQFISYILKRNETLECLIFTSVAMAYGPGQPDGGINSKPQTSGIKIVRFAFDVAQVQVETTVCQFGT